MPTSSSHALDSKVLPAVRVPTVPVVEGEGEGVAETPIVDLPSAEKFGFAYPEDSAGTSASTQGVTASPSLQRTDAEASEYEFSEAESLASRDSGTALGEKDTAESTPTNGTLSPNISMPSMSSLPRLSRAFSMPIPSQLGHLRNPHRKQTEVSLLFPSLLAQTNDRFHELSVELADSVQMVIQTLLQISPPHLLDPAKEQFSGCSLSVPCPSVSAMLTAMKNLNYMSANVSTFTEDNRLSTAEKPDDDFDIGELLQSVGDALSGLASQAGVELVLFHADVQMKHISVKNDECGISYALSHVIRQVLNSAEAGDTIEIGLHITVESSKAKDSSESLAPQELIGDTRPSSRASSFQPDFDGQLRCTFEIAHKFAEGLPPIRVKPSLETIFFRRLLRHINGSIKDNLQPRLFTSGRTCELSVLVDPGSPDLLTRPMKLSPEEEAMRQPFANANIQLATEPSLEELIQFIETLKGKKVALHASAKGSFAHHLTSYLTAWGLDVSHMSTLNSESGLPSIDELSESSSPNKDETAQISPTTILSESPSSSLMSETNPLEEALRPKGVSDVPAFVLIDDDVEALRSRLVQLRSETSFNLTMRQRPKLSAHHRPKSSPHVMRAKGIKSYMSSQSTSVVIHFTSLSKYKIVKDIIHDVLSSSDISTQIPEVIVLPKPAGPRRVLTALRTAVTKPIVDPFFSPIATSPISPNGQGVNPFSPYFHGSSPLNRAGRPSISPRTTSDRSIKSGKEIVDLVPRLPPSPLRESDTMEYFTEAAQKMGTSPSSGLVIQSPDGQPAGIFFHPKKGVANKLERTDSSSSSKIINPPHLVRDLGNHKPPIEAKKVQLPKRYSLTVDEGTPRPSAPRHRSMHAQVGGESGVSAEIISSPISTGTKTRMSMSPHGDRHTPKPTQTVPTPGTLSTPVGDPSAEASGPSNAQSPRSSGHADLAKTASPPSSPGTAKATSPPSPAAYRRSSGRRGTGDTSTASTPPATKKANKSVDGNIVPPVKVLIVEDNPINQTILSTFMKKKKIKYDVATNGAEAVEKWKSGGFHLILMDIQMPIMDGITATKKIRELEKAAHQGQCASSPPSDGQQTPSDGHSSETKSNISANTPYKSSVIIVALTASSLPSDRVTALHAGCNDFLTKPVSLLWLNSKIIEWGSIKALQMWADLRPEVVKNIAYGQMTHAREIASKLHVPEGREKEGIHAKSPASRKMSQEEAMKLLSEAGRPVTSQGLGQTEVTTESTSRAAAMDLTAEPISLLTTSESEHSSSPSVAPESTPEESLQPQGTAVPPRPKTPREVSGQEALLTHIQESFEEAANADSGPILLGEHAMASGSRSIAEVMHSDTEHTTSYTSSVYLESEDDERIHEQVASTILERVDMNAPLPANEAPPPPRGSGE